MSEKLKPPMGHTLSRPPISAKLHREGYAG